ncbi:hypothetical protein [Clostridium sp. BNL1100]|uniref:hypothetical protein n=1 Tax=Clostridium sp. BNL1100 TaxID=755731 RepID=UPI00024A7E2E|nr:hypothetical protein [Clostridium sp. BNL1100]AEY66720.1 hypothetical protein Clo1100_2554 [Clostridium sp. BNL1100]
MRINKKIIKYSIILLLITIVGIILVINFKNQEVLSNEKIINIYKENKKSFIKVKEDIEQNTSEKLNKEVQYNELAKQTNIIRVDFNRGEGEIWFIMQEDEQEKGIVYIKSDLRPEVDPGMGQCERIEKDWFYYVINRT